MGRHASYLLAALLLTAGCSPSISHTGPFDPNTPAEQEARAQISGVLQLEGETDFGGIPVQLQSANHTYVATTDSKGAFKLTGVVPGTYDLRASLQIAG